MVRILTVIAVIIVGFCSCNKEEAPLTKEQIRQRVDSIVAVRTREADEQARIDLERRIKIEVKVKADSIANAMLAKPVAPPPAATLPAAAPASPKFPKVPVK